MQPDDARALIADLERRQEARLSPVDRELWAEQLLTHPLPVGRLAVVFTSCRYTGLPTLDEFVTILQREAALWEPPRLLEVHHEAADATTVRSHLADARAALRRSA